MSVKVGVRVRPFNGRQKQLDSKLCVDMIGAMTRLFDAQDPDKHRDFTFDYSFWSHDQFFVNEKGYFEGQGEKYADQRHVYQQVGQQILSNAWEGYHCCLFAYGQTGAGKSYSMVGYGANKGIVPISCEEIFNRIALNDNPNKEYEVNVSMLQIYNERVQDLLIPMNKRTKEGLKIREHKTLGVYVQGLSKHFVDNYIAIESKMDEGSRNRSIAATQMNATSSRAHTIISIEFRQIDIADGKKREKLSVIYLVDLAGSQKVGKTGATGDRLKEAAGINKSLSVLGLVISTLAEKSTGKGKNIIVPYRDSCLTRILQNALGGNSKTLMICAISPATDNYEETLSTLRYADQAKKIQNKAVINESETDKIIRTLNAEKDQLRGKVQQMEEMFKKLSKGLGLSPEMLEQLNTAKEQLRFNTSMMNNYTLSKQEKLKIEEQESEKRHDKVDKSLPHLSNLNQDPQLSRKINYSIDKERVRIGRRGLQDANDIQIGGMGVRNTHAIIFKNNGLFYIEPTLLGDESGCYLNGDIITEETQLYNCDRLAIGANHNNIFVIIIPKTQPRSSIQQKTIDWDFAQDQLYLKKEKIEKMIMEEKEKQIKQQTEAILRKKEEELAELQRHLRESEQLRKTIEQQKQIEKAQKEKKQREEEAIKLQREIEKDKKKIQDSQSQKAEKIREKYFFEKQLLKTLPKCIELNLIAKQFKRNISMSVKMLLPNHQGEQEDIDIKKRSIKIKVINREAGYTYWWDTEKLSNRYYLIKDLSETYFENGIVPTLQQKDDPFWDPPQQCLIGRAFLTTKSLAYMFDNPVELTIIGEDDHCGQLVVNLIPTDQKGEKNLSQEMDDQIEFSPQQLIDKPFYYNLIIQSAVIPENYQNIFVQYTLKTSPYANETFKTNEIKQKIKNPQFNYVKLHSFQCLTKQLLDYLYTARLVFKIYGEEMLPQEKKQIKKEEKKQTSTVTNSTKKSSNPTVNGTPDEKKAQDESSTVKKAIVNNNQSPTKGVTKEKTQNRPSVNSQKPSNQSNKTTTSSSKNPSNKEIKSTKDVKNGKTEDKEKCIIY